MKAFDRLTDELRGLRLADEAAVIISIGSVRCRDCGPVGAIQVTASKGDYTATVEALRLEDALLMVRARLDEAEQAAKKKRDEEKKKKAVMA